MVDMTTTAVTTTPTATASCNPLSRTWDWFSDLTGLSVLAYPLLAYAHGLGSEAVPAHRHACASVVGAHRQDGEEFGRAKT
jgi:hypothetical protein